MPAKKIATAVHKGGSGKTTSTVSLAAALALEGKRVLVLDLDPQGNATQALGFDVGEETSTLRNAFGPQPMPLRSLIVPVQGAERVSLVPNDIRMERDVQPLTVAARRHELLAKALSPIEGDFDYIFMDCPPSLGLLTEWALVAADFVLIPLRYGDAHALQALKGILEFIPYIRGDETFQQWRILLTQLDRRKKTTNLHFSEALTKFQGHVLQTIIPQHESLNQSQFVQENIFSFDASGKGARAYQELAQELHTYGL